MLQDRRRRRRHRRRYLPLPPLLPTAVTYRRDLSCWRYTERPTARAETRLVLQIQVQAQVHVQV